MRFVPIYILMCATALSACGGASKSTSEIITEEAKTISVDFNADSAFAYVAAQTSFGPRVPNTQAHKLCAEWLADKLEELDVDDVHTDSVQIKAYDGTILNARNISGSINPNADKRILLLSHWDSRPWADQESDPTLRNKPIDGANDGASGVGVILEIARALKQNPAKIGVDILFVDAEDYGRRADEPNDNTNDESWALGTQYWTQNPTIDLSKIRYAILLDMVGGKNATFAREYFSENRARDINNKVWRAAAKAGHADRFVSDIGAPVMDDHIYLLRSGIPAIDIIECANPHTGCFNPTWHTLNDNIDNIDPTTLKAVGETVLTAIYNE